MGRKPREINYESYDGKFYRVEFVESAKLPEWERQYVMTTLEVDRTRFILVNEVAREQNPSPIVRAGKDHAGCPGCGEKKCLIEGRIYIKSFNDRMLRGAVEFSLKDRVKTKSLKKYITCCTSPGNERKLFLLEWLQHEALEISVDDTLRTMHCLNCNARKEMLEFEVVVTDNIYMKPDRKLGMVIIGCDVCGYIADDQFPLYQPGESLECVRTSCVSAQTVKRVDIRWSSVKPPGAKVSLFMCASCKETFFVLDYSSLKI